MEYIDLWTTEVGSAMWGMFQPGKSDHDYITVRACATRDILKGYRIHETWEQVKYMGDDEVEIDESFIEIGHLVNYLMKGNVNYLWAVTSPIVIRDHPLLEHLKRIVLNNPSRLPYHSLSGMTKSQKLDETKRPRLAGGKGYRTAARTALFGCKLLRDWTFDYKVPETLVNLDISLEDVETYTAELDNAYTESTLPDSINEENFRQFLYGVRKLEENGVLKDENNNSNSRY